MDLLQATGKSGEARLVEFSESIYRPERRSSALTYSPSITIPLTHDCPWRCSYCGYRTDKEGLISDKEVALLFARAHEHGVTEILFMSGEMPDTLRHLKKELQLRGYPRFVDFAEAIAGEALRQGFLPHTNIGALSEVQLRRLKRVNVSQGLMLENVDESFCAEVAPEKSLAGRIRTIAAAGRAKIPYTSGLLMGLGESHQSRRNSLKTLAQLHNQFGHLQEIIIQNYVSNRGSRWQAPAAPSLDQYLDLIGLWRELAPDVAVQIPPNLNPHWQELLPYIDDLGGISMEGDLINPDNPWAQVDVYAEAARRIGRRMERRLPVYPQYVQLPWQSREIAGILQERIAQGGRELP